MSSQISMDQVSQAGVQFGAEAGARLQTFLGRVPNPQEFMAFYGISAGTIIGNALSEIILNAGKEQAAQWLAEVLGIVQITARGNGADIILAGGISLKTMASSRTPAPGLAPPAPALDTNVCPCKIENGTCRECERILERNAGRYASLVRDVVDVSRDASQTKECKPCKIKLLDGVIAKIIRREAESLGDRLGAAFEILLAVITPQMKAALPEMEWPQTSKATEDVALLLQKK